MNGSADTGGLEAPHIQIRPRLLGIEQHDAVPSCADHLGDARRDASRLPLSGAVQNKDFGHSSSGACNFGAATRNAKTPIGADGPCRLFAGAQTARTYAQRTLSSETPS